MALSRSDARTVERLVARLRAEHADHDAAVIERLVQQVLAPESGAALLAGYMTTGEAAGLIGVSLQTIKNWVDRGRLAGNVVGGRTLVTRDSVREFFDALGGISEPGDGTKESTDVEVADADLMASLPSELRRQVEHLLARVQAGDRLSAAEQRQLRRLVAEGTREATAHTRQLARRLQA